MRRCLSTVASWKQDPVNGGRVFNKLKTNNNEKISIYTKIKNIEPIAGADAIEKASVLGWQLVIRKNEFAIGDLCVYIEIDSILPDKPEFELIRARSNRIKTVKLRGQISQGICFPLSILPVNTVVEEDLDVTEALGIVKYEPPVPANLAGLMKGLFPHFIPKTDETRVQVLQNELKALKGTKCYITEKLDGSSVTYFVNNGTFGACSRNLELARDENNSIWKFALENDLETKLLKLNQNIAVQGEIIGEGIQKNKYNLKGQTVYFFNAFNIDTQTYLSLNELKNILQELQLNAVPVLSENYELENEIEKLINKAKLKSALNTNTIAEGIVIRPLIEISDFRIMKGRVSFKAINPDFLIKYDE